MIRILIASIFFLLPFYISSQPNTLDRDYQQFELTDASIITGIIVFENENVVHINLLSGGELKINRDDILKQKSVVVETNSHISNDSTRFSEDILSVSEQTDSTIVRFELTGGSVLIGTIISEDSTSITLNLLSNNQTIINKNAVVSRDIVSSNIKDGQYWIEDPNSTRLFFGPTGRGLKSGKGYFAAYEIFFPMLAVGIGDYFTLAGGLSLFPGSIGDIIYIAPKIILYQDEKYALAIGDFFVKPKDNSDYLNIIYTIGTASFNKSAITAGVGYETNSKNPIFLIGGELRISRYAKLITENWFVVNSEVKFVSLGIRFLGENLAADFAFFVPLGTTEIVFVPWLGFAYNF
ncbi:MAG: hypothetical protein L3J41_15230 [Melioribacteraceae bacterium]|nr:hypothetical protein [Melioribacteraceae bacterium]